MGHERMQDQPAAARLPVRARRVIAQAGDVPPRFAIVVALEQPGRLDPGVQAGRGGRQAPHRLDRVFPGLVGETRAGVRPGRAQVFGLPHGRAEPGVPAAGVDGPRSLVRDDMVHRPGLAERAAEAPRAPQLVALEDERALLRSEQDQDFVGHWRIPRLVRSQSVQMPRRRLCGWQSRFVASRGLPTGPWMEVRRPPLPWETARARLATC